MPTGTPTGPLRPGTGRAHPARAHDRLLEGEDSRPVDGTAERNRRPEARDAVRRNRRLTHRAAARLVEQGVGRFPGIGTGVPTEPDPHRMVQDVLPAAKVVRTDNAPAVLRRLEVPPAGGPEGATDCTDTDVRGPGGIRPARPRRARQWFRTDPAPSSGEGAHAGVARVS